MGGAHFIFNPLILTAAESMQADNFDEISQSKAKLGKYLNEEFYLEHYQQIFCKIILELNYYQKYHRSRQPSPEEHLCINGL